MSHYSDDPAMVRVDFWKDTGKWYTTEAVKWIGPWTANKSKLLIHEQLRESLIKHFDGKPRLLGMRATCLEPYHEHSHPISVVIEEEWFNAQG